MEADYLPRPEHAGFTHAVHGGLITTALDEIMAWAVIVATRRPAYSAELTVRFTHPVKVGETTLLVGELVTNRRNRLFETRSEIRNAEGVLCATATGKYLPLGPEDVRLALQDFPSGEFRDWLTGATAAQEGTPDPRA